MSFLTRFFPGPAGPKPPPFDPIGEAKAMLADGAVVGKEVDNERYERFMQRGMEMPDKDYWLSIQAQRLLIDAGSIHTRDVRRLATSVHMGNIFMHDKKYIPGLVELTCGYVYGRTEVYAGLAKLIEGGGRRARQIIHAVDALQATAIGDEGTLQLGSYLSMYDLPDGVVDETLHLWDEMPTIRLALRGDLPMFCALQASANGTDRQHAYGLYNEAVKAGMVHLNVEECFRRLNDRSGTDFGPGP
jgi:hypothetical protein